MNALEALRSNSNRREKVHNAQIIAKCPQAVKDLVEGIAKEQNRSAADLVREALGDWLERRGY